MRLKLVNHFITRCIPSLVWHLGWAHDEFSSVCYHLFDHSWTALLRDLSRLLAWWATLTSRLGKLPAAPKHRQWHLLAHRLMCIDESTREEQHVCFLALFSS